MASPKTLWLPAAVLLCLPSGHAPGEKLPQGPPWHVEYRSARRAALRTGKPVYVYFTKTH